MHFIKFIIVLLLIVQFASTVSSSIDKSSTTTIKPKTSFTRHFSKLFSPIKKLFSPKPKNNTQSNNTDKFNKNESLDRIVANPTVPIDSNSSIDTNSSIDSNSSMIVSTNVSTESIAIIPPTQSPPANYTNELNILMNYNDLELIDGNISDSIDTGATEEANSTKLENLKEETVPFMIYKEVPIESETIDKINLTEVIEHFETSSLEKLQITITKQPQTTTQSDETTTTMDSRDHGKSKPDEMKICFEIEELNMRKCYTQIPNTSNFLFSKTFCETHFSKGRLITINTPDEQNFLILNNIYYFWTAFKIRIGLTSELLPHITAIKPIYKQTNTSIELIKKLDFNQNMIFSQNELSDLVANNKWLEFPTNDDKAYDEDEIRLDETNDSPAFVIVPKLYCLEASLNFENGQPLYKWMVKDCDHEITSSVCELSEPLNEEILSPASSTTTIDYKIEAEEISLSSSRISNSFIYDPLVSKMVSELLKDTLTNQTTSTQTTTRPPPLEYSTEPPVNRFFTLFPINWTEPETDTTEELLNSTLSTTTLLASTLNPFTTEVATAQTTTTTEPTTESTASILSTSIDSGAQCDSEKNPLVYQLIFAFNIAVRSFCSLMANMYNDLFKSRFIDDFDMKRLVTVFIFTIIIILFFTVIFMTVYLVCRTVFRLCRGKRRLLLDQLSEERNQKKEFVVSIDKKYESSSYYNIPHNRNIYVSNPQLTKNVVDTEKYKSIPKEYFY